MARMLRVQYPGAIYHIMNRSDGREAIFEDDADRERFIETLGEACGKTGWQVHAYCLMPDHFHLVVETPQANLATGMKWFLGTYTIRFNRRHKVFGHLFSGRYKALIVDGKGNDYLRTVCEYVHLNPSRAGLLPAKRPLREYRWSSWPDYLMNPRQRPEWLRVERLLGGYRLAQDNPASRRRLEKALESKRAEGEGAEYKAIRRGWFFGDKKLKKVLLERLSEPSGNWHSGAELRKSDEVKAERMVREELRRRKWTGRTLNKRRKGDPEKIAIARRLREETTMTLEWVADRLKMGAKTHLSNLLYWQKREKQ